MVAENETSLSLNKELELREHKDNKDTQRMSHKEWKKMKRKQKRKLMAARRKAENTNKQESSSSDEEKKIREEKEKEMQHILFLEREKLAQQLFQAKKERLKKEKDNLEEQERKIKEEWEELQRLEEKEKDRRERDEQREKDRKDSLLKEATSNENKNDWHNPIAPVTYNSQRPQNNCPFFMKTGACKYGDSCSRTHEYPAESNTVLLPGMFSHFRLDQTLIDEYDTDLSLEYEDTDLYNSFLEFYQDVLPEFQSIGKVIQFKVCSNCAPHLRGNVYVAFEKQEDASKAVMKFNGRWYAGKQLNCEYRTVDKWKSAICGLSFQKSCPKGNVCNFLHVFKNPNNEFRDADYDNQYNSRKRAFQRYDSRQGSYRRSRSPSHRRSRSPSHRRSRYRSRERYRSRSREKHRSRSRSRSSDRYKYRQKHKYIRSESRYSRSTSRSPSRSRNKEKRRRGSSSQCSPRKSQNYSSSRSKSRSRSKSKSRISRSKHKSKSKSRSDSDSGKEKKKKSKKKSKKKKKHKHHSRSRSKSPSSILKQPIDHDDINLKINKIFGSVNSQKLDAVLSATLEN